MAYPNCIKKRNGRQRRYTSEKENDRENII